MCAIKPNFLSDNSEGENRESGTVTNRKVERMSAVDNDLIN